MTEAIRLAILGGSGVATPELVDVLAHATPRPEIHIALVGRSVEKLAAVLAMCKKLADGASPAITISAYTDPREGLDGAGYVLNQVRVGGYEGRAFDETFPHEFGLPGEETFGPGGMSMALRTIPVVLELCRAIEEVAPDALLINLTNPSSIVQYAISHTTRVKVVSLCDLPMMAEEMVARALGAPVDELTFRYTGMNHFGWVTGVGWQGQDMMPRLLKKADELGLPYDVDIARALGVIPTSYFKYFYHPERMLAAQKGKRPRAEELIAIEAEILAAYQSDQSPGKPEALVRRSAAWYEHMIAPTLLAHANDTGEVKYLQVTNGSALPFMPPEAIVEVPCIVRGSGFRLLAYDHGLPPDLEALLRTNATFEMLWAEAVVEHDRQKALRAMLLNHIVTNYGQAKGLLDRIWAE